MDITSAGVLVLITVLIFSAVLHEVAHGFVADRLGDPTARLLGRLTLNPVKHLDPFMSILLPILIYISSQGSFIFGGAKPVPIDPFNLKDGRKDLAIVSLAGPITNIALAIIFSLIAHVFYPGISSLEFLLKIDTLGSLLGTIIFINLLLGIFNLFPIPPLDGSKIFALLLPEREANAYLSLGSIGIFILLLFLVLGGFSFIFGFINFAQSLLFP